MPEVHLLAFLNSIVASSVSSLSLGPLFCRGSILKISLYFLLFASVVAVQCLTRPKSEIESYVHGLESVRCVKLTRIDELSLINASRMPITCCLKQEVISKLGVKNTFKKCFGWSRGILHRM